MKPLSVIAIGGNALIRRGEKGTVEEQTAHADSCMSRIASMVARGERVVLTHGNGPFVGNMVIQMECARDTVPAMPLYMADADSEGGIGFILQQALYNRLHGLVKGINVVSVVTQVLVDKDDPAFARPTKPIGPFYAEEVAMAMTMGRGYLMAEDAGRGWRRIVPSPRPLRIVEAEVVRKVAISGDVVIAAGGGGVPVVEDADGNLHGVDAVIDKDYASSVLARQIGATRFIILTSVDCVYLDYGKNNQKALLTMDARQARAYLAEGQFPPGSMGPKVGAAVEFMEGGGKEVIITSPEMLEEALAGRAGTRII
jgi:carbamate kinase